MRERAAPVANYLYIAGTIFFTVYGQLILKWQASRMEAFPAGAWERLWFLLGLMLNPWMMSVVVAALVSLLCWTMAMTKFELSYAYPFMSLCFVLVLALSAALFGETITLSKGLGLLLIVAGIVVGTRG